MLSVIYHTARRATLILIRLSVRRDLQTFVSSITQATVRNASRGRKRLDSAMDKFEFAGASPILVAVKETRRTTPIDRLITA
jgi:hypothetical protein